jgi:hypothetical protein
MRVSSTMILGFTSAALLAACGSHTKTTTLKGSDGEKIVVESSNSGDAATHFTVTGKDGAKGSVDVHSGGAKWPADAPAYAPVYPGGKVTTVVKSANPGGEDSTLAGFETGDAPDKIIGFYEPLAAKAGLARVTSMTSGNMQMFGAEGDNGNSMLVQVTSDKSKSVAMLTYTRKPG